MCLEFLNYLKLLKTTNKYITTYRDAPVYIMAEILMQTFDYTKVVGGQKRTLSVKGVVLVN